MKVTVCDRQPRAGPGRAVDVRRVKAVARHALRTLGATTDQVNIVLVDDQAIAELNQLYHHVAGPTDVLSFDYTADQQRPAPPGPAAPAQPTPPPRDAVTGELIVSTERARAQARHFHSTPARELALYVIHGLLHLHGFDDHTPAQRRAMRRAERRLLAALPHPTSPRTTRPRRRGDV